MVLDTDVTDTDDVDGTDPTEPLTTAAKTLADAVRTTLGPQGMDKMLIDQGGTVVVTNDGAHVLDNLTIDAPVGRMIARAAGAQADTVGDGTTTTVVLIGELLGAAASLRADGLHPTTIADGYIDAADYARRTLPEYGVRLDGRDETRLRRVAETAVTGRWDDRSTERFAALTVDALWRVEFDPSRLSRRAYAGGELRQSELVDGIVVDVDASSTSLDAPELAVPSTQYDPTVAMVDAEIGVRTADRIESVELHDADQVEAFRTREQRLKHRLVERIVESTADVLICQKAIDETVRTQLAQRGVRTVERTRRDEFDAIARVTDSDPVRSVADLTPSETGAVASVQRRTVGTTPILVVEDGSGTNRASLVLRGGTPHVANEVRRIVEDCLAVVRLALDDGVVVPGGGASTVALASDVAAQSTTVADRRQLVYDAFADALLSVPRTLAANAGRDPIDTLVELQRRHDAGDHTVGVGPDGSPAEMVDSGVVEPLSVFDSSLCRAVDVVSTILRVDDVVTTGSDADDHSHDHGSHVGADTGGYPWAVGH